MDNAVRWIVVLILIVLVALICTLYGINAWALPMATLTPTGEPATPVATEENGTIPPPARNERWFFPMILSMDLEGLCGGSSPRVSTDSLLPVSC